jgi:hypothetical protein
MMKSALGICAAALMAAAPACATSLVDLSFGGTVQNAPQFSYTSGGIDFTVQARTWSHNPDPLTSLSQLSPTWSQVSRTEPGIGVTGGNDSNQIDTSLPLAREGILLTGSEAFSIHGLQLSLVGGVDSLALYGVDGNTLVFLGYPGLIANVEDGPNADLYLLAGQATGPFLDPANGGTQRLTLVNPTAAFSAYFFTTREPGTSSHLNAQGKGYRLDSIQLAAAAAFNDDGFTDGAVPEPASWALLIAGFGMIGAVSRRRRITVAA